MVSIHGSWLEFTGGISPFVVELCGEKIIMFQGGSWILRDSVPIPAEFFVCIFCIFGMNLDNSQNNEPCAAYGFLRGNASCDEKQFYSILPIFSATECYGASGNVRLWGRLWFDFPARDLNKILGTVPRQVGVGFVARLPQKVFFGSFRRRSQGRFRARDASSESSETVPDKVACKRNCAMSFVGKHPAFVRDIT